MLYSKLAGGTRYDLGDTDNLPKPRLRLVFPCGTSTEWLTNTFLPEGTYSVAGTRTFRADACLWIAFYNITADRLTADTRLRMMRNKLVHESRLGRMEALVNRRRPSDRAFRLSLCKMWMVDCVTWQRHVSWWSKIRRSLAGLQPFGAPGFQFTT